jgi:hypothetical protein
MNQPTSSDLRKRSSEIETFAKYWYVNSQTSEIRHATFNFWRKLINLFWRKKHKVSNLYWWTVQNWATSEMIIYPDAIRHDDLHIKGYPRKYQLKNGWTIPSKDLKYLYEGPLVDESGTKVLVKHQSTTKNIISFISQLRPLSWIITLVLTCFRFRVEIIAVWQKFLDIF